MGISFSGALDENERQSNVNVIHELYSLERKVRRKLEEQVSKLYINALHDECLPIVCAVDKKQKILLNVNSLSSDEVRTKINEILHGDYLEELIKLLAEKLNIALQNNTIGEEESLYTHVVFANKSVLRIDLFVYHRRFRHTESLSEYNNILAYFVQVGLVEIMKARPQVLIYELTRATDHTKLNNACEKLEAWAKYTERLNYTLQLRAKAPSLPMEEASAAEDVEDEQLWCFCRGPEEGFMIQCDKQGPLCFLWYHGPCVKISKKKAKKLPSFVCFNCNNCRIKKSESEERHSSFLDNLTWGSFGKFMALTITFAICSALTVHKCNIDSGWRSLTNLFFSIRELSKRQMPGLYLLYFCRR